jgi:hypothetical protein
MMIQTIRKDLLEGGSGESHGGLQEGGINKWHKQSVYSRERMYQNDGTITVTGQSTFSAKTC